MIKLPQPLGIVKYSSNQMKYIEWGAVHWTHVLDAGDKLYKEAQLKQAVRDAYEEAAKKSENASSTADGADIAAAIRALIEEIV